VIVLYAALAAVLVMSSLMVILHKHPVTSALFLVLAFCSLGGIYLLMRAEFIGFVQVIVYAGAIMVLFLFVIMYLNLQHDVESGVAIALRRGLGWIVAGIVLAEAVALVARRWYVGPVTARIEPVPGNTQMLGQHLYTRYLVPFEITSLLLLVAMIGVVVIARGRPGAGTGEGREGSR
jgi:NADH-quinone oxidoreductase subunit J